MIRKKTENSSGFSLVEVTIALAIIAFGLIAIFGLIPVAMTSARSAVDDTRTSLIAQDAANRSIDLLTGTATPSLFTTGATAVRNTLYYDREGRFIPPSGTSAIPLAYTSSDYINGDALYRVDITVKPFKLYPTSADQNTTINVNGNAMAAPYPANVANPLNSSGATPATAPGGNRVLGVTLITIGWPVDTANGTLVNSGSGATKTTYSIYSRLSWGYPQ